MRLWSFACNKLKLTDFERVAENSFTGIETNPKEMLPLAIGRDAIVGGASVPVIVPACGGWRQAGATKIPRSNLRRNQGENAPISINRAEARVDSTAPDLTFFFKRSNE